MGVWRSRRIAWRACLGDPKRGCARVRMAYAKAPGGGLCEGKGCRIVIAVASPFSYLDPFCPIASRADAYFAVFLASTSRLRPRRFRALGEVRLIRRFLCHQRPAFGLFSCFYAINVQSPPGGRAAVGADWAANFAAARTLNALGFRRRSHPNFLISLSPSRRLRFRTGSVLARSAETPAATQSARYARASQAPSSHARLMSPGNSTMLMQQSSISLPLASDRGSPVATARATA